MTSCPRCGRYTTAPTHCGADVGQAAVCGCSHAAMSHSYAPELGRNAGRCLGLGCACSAYVESAQKAREIRGKSAPTWENESGPEGALTPESPALTCVTRSDRGARL